MRERCIRLGMLLLLALAGPASSEEADHIRLFTLHLTTDPPNSRMSWSAGSGSPGHNRETGAIEFMFRRQAAGNVMGKLGFKAWKPLLLNDQPWTVEETKEAYLFKTVPITLSHKGYKPKTVSFTWSIPKDLQERNEKGFKAGEVTNERWETVMFQNPTRPHFIRKITLEASPGPAALHVLNDDGTLGEKVADTPYQAVLGFAVQRNELGEFQHLRRWIYNKPDLFRHRKRAGRLFLDAVLVREGFEPEILADHPIMTPLPDQPTEHTAVLQLTTPSKPEGRFVLNLDSLPSKAAVFVLNHDGSVGEKLGDTPARLVFGFGQQSKYHPSGTYVHKDWLMWDEFNLLDKQIQADGTTVFSLRCALFLEGYATQKVFQPIISLTPGAPFPQGRTLNIPLLKPEQAAALEMRRTMVNESKAKAAVAPAEPPIRNSRRSFIWKAPEAENGEP